MDQNLREAVAAAQGRKAIDLKILDLAGTCSFTDFFLICGATSTRHAQAISDAIAEDLKGRSGLRPSHLEGYGQGEWILMDYLNFVVHIFTERMREFYDLERLWKKSRRVPVPEG
jgi:ribosome-associated protein